MKLASFAIAVTLALTPAVIFAQSAPNHPDPTINQRKENQQDRIAQGVKSGDLKAGQTARLEHQEAGINKEERGMRAQDNGHLTAPGPQDHQPPAERRITPHLPCQALTRESSSRITL
jgi:hypothetical protein